MLAQLHNIVRHDTLLRLEKSPYKSVNVPPLSIAMRIP